MRRLAILALAVAPLAARARAQAPAANAAPQQAPGNNAAPQQRPAPANNAAAQQGNRPAPPANAPSQQQAPGNNAASQQRPAPATNAASQQAGNNAAAQPAAQQANRPAPPANAASQQAPAVNAASQQTPGNNAASQPANRPGTAAVNAATQPANAATQPANAASQQTTGSRPAATAGAAATGTAATEAATGPGRLTLSTRDAGAATALLACADALDHERREAARARCGEAIARDDGFAFAHLLLAQVSGPEAAARELGRATELSRGASPGEAGFIIAYRALLDGRAAEARAAYDQVVATLPAEPRAFLARGRFRLLYDEVDHAAADFQKAVELAPRLAAARAALALVQAARGQLDEATATLKAAAELAPTEPDVVLALARLELRRGLLDEATADARRALELDGGFLPSHALLGDALLFSGHGREARRHYAALSASNDAELHHDGAMREARSWLFDGRTGDAERALLAEAELAGKAGRPVDRAQALIELGRIQLDRAAVVDAGQALRLAREALEAPETAARVTEWDRRRLGAEGLHVRAMVLGAVGERALASARADEMGALLKLAGDSRAGAKATALKGWIAARNGDDAAALTMLAPSPRPTLRMALALAAARSGDTARARTIMEELARRASNDVEGALTRPRAAAWLKAR